jgi:hypothetical protein
VSIVANPAASACAFQEVVSLVVEARDLRAVNSRRIAFCSPAYRPATAHASKGDFR